MPGIWQLISVVKRDSTQNASLYSLIKEDFTQCHADPEVSNMGLYDSTHQPGDFFLP